uniref:Uncharacterized protein n=1 Tax=Arundo donax TaxID=35708 RepID=A0A0A9CTB2_ARUDO
MYLCIVTCPLFLPTCRIFRPSIRPSWVMKQSGKRTICCTLRITVAHMHVSVSFFF